MLRGRPLLCTRSPDSPSCLHPFYLRPPSLPSPCQLCPMRAALGPQRPWGPQGLLSGSGKPRPRGPGGRGLARPRPDSGPTAGNFRAAPPAAHSPADTREQLPPPLRLQLPGWRWEPALTLSKLRGGAPGTWVRSSRLLAGPALISPGLPLLPPPDLWAELAHCLQEALQDQSSLPRPQSRRSGEPWGFPRQP